LAPHVGKLSSLRNLSTYLVGLERGFLLEELGPLKLKRDVEIKYLERVKSVNDAKEANMSSKQLNKLTLTWKVFIEREVEYDEVLEDLEQTWESSGEGELDGYDEEVLEDHEQTWESSGEGELEGNDEEVLDEKVLEALQPCTETLQSLIVEGYYGVCFPEWISSPSLRYLTDLVLWNCGNCVQLPVLGKLPSLNYLQIVGSTWVR